MNFGFNFVFQCLNFFSTSSIIAMSCDLLSASNLGTCKVPPTFGDSLSASNLRTCKVPLTLGDPLSASDLGTRKVSPTI